MRFAFVVVNVDEAMEDKRTLHERSKEAFSLLVEDMHDRLNRATLRLTMMDEMKDPDDGVYAELLREMVYWIAGSIKGAKRRCPEVFKITLQEYCAGGDPDHPELLYVVP